MLESPGQGQGQPGAHRSQLPGQDPGGAEDTARAGGLTVETPVSSIPHPRAGGAGDTLGQRCSVFLASCEAVTGLFAGGGPSSFCKKEEGGRWGRGLESHLQTLQGTVGGAERSPASCPPDPVFCGRAGGAAPCIPSTVTEPLGAWTGFGQSAGSTQGYIIQASAPACGLSYPPCLPRTRRRLWLRTSTLR